MVFFLNIFLEREIYLTPYYKAHFFSILYNNTTRVNVCVPYRVYKTQHILKQFVKRILCAQQKKHRLEQPHHF